MSLLNGYLATLTLAVVFGCGGSTHSLGAVSPGGTNDESRRQALSTNRAEAAPAKVPVVLDTDLGTDIDDAFALALVLASPELDLLGVTTVSDDAYGRALIACRFLDAAGRNDVPVAAGRLRRDIPAVAGQYQYGRSAGPKQPVPELAVEFLYRQLKARPGEITIITVGDQTNLRDLITRHPEAKPWIRRVVMMGGSVRVGYGGQPPPEREWNIRSDVKSTQLLFRSGIPLVVAPLDATLVRFPEPLRRRVFETPNALGRELWSLYKLWGKQTPTLFDPVAVTLAFNESFVTMEPLRIEVDDQGFTREVAGEANCRAAMAIRAEAFLDCYVQRIVGFRPGAPKATSAVAAQPPPSPLTVAQLIRAAGTTQDELERLNLLRKLAARTDLDEALHLDLGKLLPVVEEWADGKSRPVVDPSRAAENGYLCRFITGRVRPAEDGPVHPPELSHGSPLRPLWCLYRGRMLIWQVIQSGPLLRVKESREKYYGEARRLLEEARQAFPENRVVRMYLGEPIPWPEPHPADPEAPAWASLQREGLEKLADVIYWWVGERQLPDGQFGGGWGDDVEMWRWWAPVLIGFDDPVVNSAQERLSSGIFQQPHMRAGFTSRVTDVEHSNEDTTDTILPMMHLRPGDPVWKQRAVRLAELMRDRWTGRNEQGFLQFKSIYFSVDKVDTNAARAFDTVYHPSIIQPTLLYWQRSRDPALTALFGEWLKLWVDAAARAENGKPAGVLPSAIRWPDGTIAKSDQPWWEPFSPGHNDALYNWPSAMRLMTSTLLLAYQMTREEKFLDPIRSMAALRAKHSNSSEGEPGSEAWCAHRMSGFLSDALAKYRLLTGDTQHDALLRTDASGYVRYRLTGDRVPLEAALRRNAEAFRSNWEAYTEEMRWTDRVMSFTRNFLNYLPEPAPPAPSPDILYSTATGDPGNPLVFPLNAVRWVTPPRDIAVLVTESSHASFAAELFHFGNRPRDLDAELFLLAPGEYQMTLSPATPPNSPALQHQEFRAEDSRARVSLRLPARRLCVVRVAPLERK